MLAKPIANGEAGISQVIFQQLVDLGGFSAGDCS